MENHKWLYVSLDSPQEAIGPCMASVKYSDGKKNYIYIKTFSVPPEEFSGSVHGQEYENL